MDPSVTYLSSPSQLKRLPISNFLPTLRIRIYYLSTKVPTTNPFNKNCGINIHDKILQNAEHNKGTAMVCHDLSAAFDTVNHTILKTVKTLFWS